ncbi:ABC transporter substrate-binding protein [Roseomonas sp. CCTCC AB2023176]|uniref:ABC transporter substrate-binding protein n=1 Tax=Roseomonas sp. CCTCC AB2023176 TaxID=3342640 RepID=UPI0035D9A17A
MPGVAARWDALRGGVADAAMHLEHLEGGPDFDARFEWGRAAHAMSVMYYLNASHGVFASAAARMAANLAVDKRAIVDGLFHGLGEVSSSVVSPSHLGMRASAAAPIPYDPDAARRLLDALGGGGPVVLRTPLTMPERAPEISERVAADLRAVGFDVTIAVQPDRPEYAREVGRKEMGDLAIFDSTPHSTFRVLDDKVSSASRAIWWQGFEDGAFEALFTAARAEVEDDAREAAYGRCLGRLRENPPWLYLFHPVIVFAARPGVARLSLDPKGVLGVW